jgi:hypothetical protein
MRQSIRALGFALLLLAIPMLAHHSFSAQYDSTKPIKLTGKVTKVEWTNPHIYFYIDVKDEKTGKVTNWALEMGSPNALMRLGWSRNSMKIDDVVNVDATLAKDGSNLANVRTVTLASNGKRLLAGSSEGTTP